MKVETTSRTNLAGMHAPPAPVRDEGGGFDATLRDARDATRTGNDPGAAARRSSSATRARTSRAASRDGVVKERGPDESVGQNSAGEASAPSSAMQSAEARTEVVATAPDLERASLGVELLGLVPNTTAPLASEPDAVEWIAGSAAVATLPEESPAAAPTGMFDDVGLESVPGTRAALDERVATAGGADLPAQQRAVEAAKIDAGAAGRALAAASGIAQKPGAKLATDEKAPARGAATAAAAGGALASTERAIGAGALDGIELGGYAARGSRFEAAPTALPTVATAGSAATSPDARLTTATTPDSTNAGANAERVRDVPGTSADASATRAPTPTVEALGAREPAADAQARPATTTEGAVTPVHGARATDAGTAQLTRAELAGSGPTLRADNGDEAGFLRRVHRLVRRAVSNGDSEVRIRLDPPQLGRIDVAVRLAGEQVGIRFSVDQDTIRSAIADSRGDLERALESHGYTLGEVSVNLRQQADGRDDGAARGHASRAPMSEAQSAGNAAPERITRALERYLGALMDLRG